MNYKIEAVIYDSTGTVPLYRMWVGDTPPGSTVSFEVPSVPDLMGGKIVDAGTGPGLRHPAEGPGRIDRLAASLFQIIQQPVRSSGVPASRESWLRWQQMVRDILEEAARGHA